MEFCHIGNVIGQKTNIPLCLETWPRELASIVTDTMLRGMRACAHTHNHSYSHTYLKDKPEMPQEKKIIQIEFT